MKGFGIHSGIRTMNWTPAATDRAVGEAVKNGFDFVGIARSQPTRVDRAHSARLCEEAGTAAVCSLGLPEGAWPSRDHEAAIAVPKLAVDATADMGAPGIGEVIGGGLPFLRGKAAQYGPIGDPGAVS